MVTDPPYYDSVPYSDLSDFFYVWIRRTLNQIDALDFFSNDLTPKDQEMTVNHPKNQDEMKRYSKLLEQAFSVGRDVTSSPGIGVIVFAHKSTSGWEALLEAIVRSGWVVTASWPIDTERTVRMNALDTASLGSSVHIVCRPRENPDGSLRSEIGDWRDVLQELPQRIHDWMPRLADEGVVGADAIFACLGPALEIFSRYSSVEKASGEEVTLREYLEYVWGAVSKEALGMIFTDADTTDFEEDARLTAMWLWTLSAGSEAPGAEPGTEDDDDDDGGGSGKSAKSTGYTLEYDAARKIAQGLGAHLDKLTTLVEIKGDKARLLPVGERAQALFGKEDLEASTSSRKKKSKDKQLDLFAVLGTPEDSDSGSVGDPGVPQVGKTVLDRLHQSMILFAAGRSEALKRFLVEEGIGADQRYWKLAQAFSALYPTGTDEKRWVDGVLARKKGLGF
jgi:putative DNA methylase